MAAKSSFLPRLSFSRGDSTLLPFHQTSHPLRTKTSEYDLDELSPRVEDAFLSPEPARDYAESSFIPRRRSPSTGASERDFAPAAGSRMKPRVLFAGPPPPIATSTLLYKDVEDRGASPPQRTVESAVSSARNVIGTVLFDRLPSNPKDRSSTYELDSLWRSLQRREKTLQKELQYLLDTQAAGLSAGLNRPLNPSPSPGPSSDGGSSTPTGTFYTSRSSRLPLADRSTSSGEVIPVRQPRPKKMGLRAARSGLARSMMLLADLKAEEDASLASALSARKRALTQLRKLSAQRDSIADELRSLEDDDEEPLTRELKDLGEEHHEVCDQISELEERLDGLKNRRRVLERQMEDVNNRREAGLSGYRGALREVEAQVSVILRRPPVKPLDVEALVRDGKPNGGNAHQETPEESPGGVEFLRLRPERRTALMANNWWEAEITILAKRKAEVGKERAALEEGAEVWKESVQLVSGFESDLRKQMSDGVNSTDKGKNRIPTPEERMLSQLSKMGGVITGLEQRMRIVEDNGWNLLICAIGAELEAFREAEQILREALRDAGFHLEDEDDTPRLARSASSAHAKSKGNSHDERDTLVDTHDDNDDKGTESDNEVPPDLLVSHAEDHQEVDPGHVDQAHEKDDSENEVPPEFLAQHHDRDGVE